MDSLQLVVDSLQAIISKNATETDLVQRATWVILIPFAIAFAFITFVVYRSRREALFRQKESELNRQISEVEMKALRSQLNPHFIFNCLNSISQFVHTNDNVSAGNYLVKFSKLMRLVLENSMHHQVSLKDDLNALTMYIEMEKLRMSNKFDFVISVSPDIDAENVLVPPLIVQPFVENSIWHGLNNKNSNGQIEIDISRNDGMLRYVVTDNGNISNEVDNEERIRQGKKRSLGMSLTRERLDVLNKTKGSNANFILTDLTDEEGKYSGKKLELMLPFEEEN